MTYAELATELKELQSDIEEFEDIGDAIAEIYARACELQDWWYLLNNTEGNA